MNNGAMINQYATPTEMSLLSRTKPLNFPLVITYTFIYVKDFGVYVWQVSNCNPISRLHVRGGSETVWSRVLK